MTTLRGSYNYLWDVSKPLGQGATSMVYRGRNKSTGDEVAVKVFSQAGHMRPQDVQMREYDVMRKLKHRNIVPLLGIEEEQGTHNQVIVMQLTDHGSLFNMLEDPKNAYGLPEEEFIIVFEHITAGMKYIRDSGIVHRDIKPGNILRYIGEDGRSIYRLTDFGAAKELENEEEQFMSLYGTEEYLHPDIYERAVLRNPLRRQFTSKVDLWSLGVTFFHVATGQLPFKPFGGRKNRAKMFEITRHKESGVILGIQHTEGGVIEWSRELPATCRISNGLKLLITPILARLLESVPERVWNFDTFFKEVDNIVRKKIISVFCPHTWNSLKVYINGESNLTRLQELIAEQTDIQSSNQRLIFDGQLLKDHVQSMLPISNYPEGITDINPILCFSKNLEEFGRFPNSVIKDFPKFTSSFTTEDYAISKMCSAISCYILKEVSIYYHKQKLLRRSVHLYVHELYHECDHLMDYHLFLERNCYSTLKWKEHFLRTFKRELTLIKMLVQQSGQGDAPLNNIVIEMETFYTSCAHDIGELSSQIEQLGDEVTSHIVPLKDDHLQRKLLEKQWNDSIGCIGEDRCVAKVEVVVEQILKIKTQFYEDRKRPSLNFNEEQIHKFEKNKLSENCITVKSLFFDHCFNGAKDQFARFHSWYKMALEVRQQSEIIEDKLQQLAERLESFVSKLNTLCLKFSDELERYIHNIDDKIREKEFISIRPEIPVTSDHSSQGAGPLSGQSSGQTNGQATGKKIQRQRLLQEVINGLLENQNNVLDMKRELEINTGLLKTFSEELVLPKDLNKRSDQQDF